MTSLYDSLEIGDTISLPLSMLAVKSGVIAKIVKTNGDALKVICTNGAVFPLSRYVRNFTLWCD
jgi:hypothetical protein